MASVVLFDGVCNLCNAVVQFVIRRDRARRFQFATLESASACRVLGEANARVRTHENTVVLVENGRVYTRSSAALRMVRGLPFPWPLAAILLLIPRPARDWGYDVVARNRYRWFGTRGICMVPTPELRSRFLND